MDEELINDFGVLLGAAARLERIVARAFERECGISHPMFEVLLYLSRVPGGLPMGEIAGDLILTSGGMTRLIDRMVAAGLVARRPSATDRRIQLAELTPLGRDTLNRAREVHTRTLQRVFADPLTADQRTALLEALHTLNTQARTELGTLG